MDLRNILLQGLGSMVPGGAFGNTVRTGMNLYNQFSGQPKTSNKGYNDFGITDDMIRKAQPAYRDVPSYDSGITPEQGSPLINNVDTTNYSQNPNVYQGGPQWQRWMNNLIGGR